VTLASGIEPVFVKPACSYFNCPECLRQLLREVTTVHSLISWCTLLPLHLGHLPARFLFCRSQYYREWLLAVVAEVIVEGHILLRVGVFIMLRLKVPWPVLALLQFRGR